MNKHLKTKPHSKRDPLFPVSKAAAAGYCRRLSALLASGTPLPEALLYSAKDGSRRIRQAAERLLHLDCLTTQTAFQIHIYRRL